MAIKNITLQELHGITGKYLLIDVRSPAEFAHAHIPGAINLPLFTNEERKVVGTAYKQESREKAIKIGLVYFGPKMVGIIEQVEKAMADLMASSNSKNKNENTAAPMQIVVHCWRGGMRSAGVAWLLDLYGYKVSTIVGGYKSFRKWAQEQFQQPFSFKVIGGYTGSGKTELLHELKKNGAVVLDLEQLANHKGSAFGNLADIAQPTQEMFENMLALAVKEVGDKIIWVEDESQRIGHINMPNSLYDTKQAAEMYFIDIPFSERLKHIVAGYGRFQKDKLVTAIMRIKKRLGGLETKTAINFLLEDDVENCFAILLKYYDKCYLKDLNQKRDALKTFEKIPCQKVEAVTNAAVVLRLERNR